MGSGPLIVTLDGPAGSGKTTVSRLVAAGLDIAYLDSGAMFRAAALLLGPQSWTWSEDLLHNRLSMLRFELHGRAEDSQLLLNGSPLHEEDIRREDVGMWASRLAKLKMVREHLKAAQRALGSTTPLVAEGRDMGTAVFPWAEHKFFLEAKLEERARRRLLQLREMGVRADLHEITGNLRLRDEQDRNRDLAPLKPAEDAVLIDTTSLDAKEAAQMIIVLVGASVVNPEVQGEHAH